LDCGGKRSATPLSDLGDSNHASPAVANGRLFLVGAKNLHCIGKKP